MNSARPVFSPSRPPLRWLRRGLFALVVLLSTSLRAQLVTYRVGAHQTDLHSGRWVDTVVWVFEFPDKQLSTVHVRLTEPGVTLERQDPFSDWSYMWALPSWSFGVDLDFLGWHAEYQGEEWPPSKTAYFGVEFEPNPTLTAALLNAEITYEFLSPDPPDFVPVPESATWGWLASLLLVAAPALRHRPRRSDC